MKNEIVLKKIEEMKTNLASLDITLNPIVLKSNRDLNIDLIEDIEKFISEQVKAYKEYLENSFQLQQLKKNLCVADEYLLTLPNTPTSESTNFVFEITDPTKVPPSLLETTTKYSINKKVFETIINTTPKALEGKDLGFNYQYVVNKKVRKGKMK